MHVLFIGRASSNTFFIREISKARPDHAGKDTVTLNNVQREKVSYWRFLINLDKSIPWSNELMSHCLPFYWCLRIWLGMCHSPVHHEQTGTSAASAIREPIHHEQTDTSAASAIREPHTVSQLVLVLYQLFVSQYTMSKLVQVLHQLSMSQHTVNQLVLVLHQLFVSWYTMSKLVLVLHRLFLSQHTMS